MREALKKDVWFGGGGGGVRTVPNSERGEGQIFKTKKQTKKEKLIFIL